MTPDTDPPRLTDEGGDAPESVRQLLASCREDVGTPEEMRALEARLAPMLWVPSPVPVPGAGTGGTLLTALKAGALVAITAGAGVSFWVGTSEKPAPLRSPFAPVAIPAPQRPVIPVPAPLPAAPVQPSTVATMPRVPSSAHPAASAETPSESELLSQAQAALGADAAKALALSEQHRRSFPHGVLAQEREVIAIEALARLGRTADVKARAGRFLAAYPDSAHRSKIQSLLGSE